MTTVTVQLIENGPITEMDPALLSRVDHTVDNDHEHTKVTEYWLDRRCVHRSVHVTLKQGIDMMPVQGEFGG